MKNKKKLSVFIYVIIVLCLLLVVVLGFRACGNNAEVQQPETGTTPEVVVPDEDAENKVQEIIETPQQVVMETTAPVGYVKEEFSLINGEIITPYLTLKYDDAFSDILRVVKTSDEPYTLEFYAILEDKPAHRIFDIYLGEGVSNSIGVVKTGDGEIALGLTIYAFTPDEKWSEGEINTIYAMQDEMNEMIEGLIPADVQESPKAPVVSTEVPEANITNFMPIKTPYCTLQFPVEWKEFLLVEQEEGDIHKVYFYGQIEGHEKILLFTILLRGDEGEQFGAIIFNDEIITVNLIVEELMLEGWSEEDSMIVYAIQEDINQLLEQLPLL